MAKAPSMWMIEKYTSTNGKVYQRYVLDSNGNKIPKDPNASPEAIAEILNNRKTEISQAQLDSDKREKKVIRQLNKAYKVRHGKRIVPLLLLGAIRKAYDHTKNLTGDTMKGKITAHEFSEKNGDYRVIDFDLDTDWLLIHATVKKGTSYINKWFYFNPYNEQHIDFNVNSYLALPKPRKIEWPVKSTVAPPVLPEVKFKKSRKAKDVA